MQTQEPGQIAAATAGKSAEERDRIARQIHEQNMSTINEVYQKEIKETNRGLRSVMANSMRGREASESDAVRLHPADGGKYKEMANFLKNKFNEELKATNKKLLGNKLSKDGKTLKGSKEAPKIVVSSKNRGTASRNSDGLRKGKNFDVKSGAAEAVSFTGSSGKEPAAINYGAPAGASGGVMYKGSGSESGPSFHGGDSDSGPSFHNGD